jgi:hypothetical protein
VHQPLRMHPAQRMPANGKLAGIVADNHHVAQQPVRVDAAPQCPFGGDADWSGVTCTVLMRRQSRCVCQAT